MKNAYVSTIKSRPQSSINSFTLINSIFLICLHLSGSVQARDCIFYTDSLGRRRRKCYGLLPGIIAALVVGVLVVLAFLSLAFFLQRRRQRAALQRTSTSIPTMMTTTQLGNHQHRNQQPNFMIYDQVPIYPPPPSYPLSGPTTPSIILPPQVYGKEKSDPDSTLNPLSPIKTQDRNQS